MFCSKTHLRRVFGRACDSDASERGIPSRCGLRNLERQLTVDSSHLSLLKRRTKKATEFDKETGSGKREEGPVDALRIWNETSTVNGWQKIP
jgi:hypothetical protein